MRLPKMRARLNRRRRGWGFDRNDLRREVDRAQMFYGLLLLILFLAVTPPVSAHAVQAVYDSGVRAERYEATTRHRVDATVVGIKRLHTGREVTVTWTAPDGTLRRGHYTTWRGASLGDHPKVWTRPGGVGEDPPRAHARTIGDAAAGGATTTLASGLASVGVYLLLRRHYDKRRYRMWDEAWAGFDRRRIGP
ncbi:Rv1733c family protein [Actinomadura bangladeshensis]|uniref:Uncharacterized protein n=1 Tax=Actinomadura bangladeshensis TaxID=453573 RepID=A0A4R4P7M6_9ACTN|nr:hypothetical protein [Actinomadura bangladeshensis]TDC16172.1 hypothetical protein E1284_13585 [Actinomadura bangladeshensis]